MNEYVIDAYAWIEYLDGTKIGQLVKEIIEDKNNKTYTNIITVAELASIFIRKKYNFEECKKSIVCLTNFYWIDVNFAEEAGKLHAKIKKERKHMGMADVFVLLTAKRLNAKIITGDEDFRGLKEVIMLK